MQDGGAAEQESEAGSGQGTCCPFWWLLTIRVIGAGSGRVVLTFVFCPKCLLTFSSMVFVCVFQSLCRSSVFKLFVLLLEFFFCNCFPPVLSSDMMSQTGQCLQLWLSRPFLPHLVQTHADAQLTTVPVPLAVVCALRRRNEGEGDLDRRPLGRVCSVTYN